MIVDLATGEVPDDLRLIDTQYGLKLRSDEMDVWAPIGAPVRRTTCERKGYTYAEATFLVRTFKRGGWERLARLSSPVVDDWGVAIERS